MTVQSDTQVYDNADALVLHLASLVIPRGAYVSTPPMDLHATDFTIAAKINLAATVSRNILIGNRSSNQRSWQLLFAVNAEGKLSIELRKDMPTGGDDPEQSLVSLVGQGVVQAGVWQHVAVTFTWGVDNIQPTCTLYLEGAPVGSVSPAITPNPKVRNPYTLMPSKNLYLIGRKEDSTGDDSWFNGQMQDFRVYRAALEAGAITQLAKS